MAVAAQRPCLLVVAKSCSHRAIYSLGEKSIQLQAMAREACVKVHTARITEQDEIRCATIILHFLHVGQGSNFHLGHWVQVAKGSSKRGGVDKDSETRGC